jgi:Protein of unknown function (DUF3106)
MKLWRQFGKGLCGLGLTAALLLPCAAAQKDRPPRPAPRAEHNNRGNDRPANAGRGQNAPRYNANGGRGTTPSPNAQERWRNMSPQERQRVFQNEQRLRNLPPAQQQELRNRAQVWQRMTPEQRDHIRNDVLPKWRQMSRDRRQAIQQRLRILQNMPEAARNQRLNDPNFTRGMSEEDKSTLHDLSHLHVGGAPDPPGE